MHKYVYSSTSMIHALIYVAIYLVCNYFYLVDYYIIIISHRLVASYVCNYLYLVNFALLYHYYIYITLTYFIH